MCSSKHKYCGVSKKQHRSVRSEKACYLCDEADEGWRGEGSGREWGGLDYGEWKQEKRWNKRIKKQSTLHASKGRERARVERVA